MKVNLFTLVIALLIGGLTFYGFYVLADNLPASILGSVLCTLFLALSIGTNVPEYPRSSMMFKVLSGLLFVILLIANLVFTTLKMSDTVFIITNGLVAAIGGIGLHFIYKSEQ